MTRFRIALLTLPLVLFIFGLTSCCSLLHGGKLTSGKLDTPQLVSHEGKSTVALVSNDASNTDDKVSDTRVYCSAVWVDDKYILTAHHCVKSEQVRAQEEQDEREKNSPNGTCGVIQTILGLCDPNASTPHKVIKLEGLPIHYIVQNEVMGIGKEPSAQHLGKVVGWDDKKDLALVEAIGEAIPVHEVAKLADKTPGLAEPVHICGHTKGFYWTFLEGTVAGYRDSIPHIDSKSGPFMQVEAPVYFGNSGGGAFDDYGNLVGIADFLLKMPGQAFFVHLDSLHHFLDEQNLHHIKDGPVGHAGSEISSDKE